METLVVINDTTRWERWKTEVFVLLYYSLDLCQMDITKCAFSVTW